MNKFLFVGRLAEAPTLTHPKATAVAKFVLLRNEYAGREEGSNEAKERVVRLQFTAFGGMAEAIAKHCHKGDQLIVESRIENNDYTDNNDEKQYGFSWIVQGFEFGAPGAEKRELLAERAS